MFDQSGTTDDLRRPRLLMRAARIALADYRRSRDLVRILPAGTPQGAAMDWLRVEEARLESARLAGSAAWSGLRHIEVLTALLAELALTRGGQE